MTVELSEAERRRISYQARFDASKETHDRNVMGQFATPQQLARDIAKVVAEAWRFHGGRIRFLEPAIGTGAFYSALLEVFPRSKWESATGIEIDAGLAESARKIWGNYPLDVITGDFTKLDPAVMGSRLPNLIVTNPPYVRHHHMNSKTKGRIARVIQDRLGLRVSQLSGLYSYFILLSDAWLEEGGVGAWLVPSEFMDVGYGSVLRQYLTQNVTLLRIHRFNPSEVQFEDALVTSAVLVFKKAKPGKDHLVQVSYDGSLISPAKVQTIGNEILSSLPKWTEVTFGGGVAEERPGVVALSNFFDVKRGLATGDNDFFILPKEVAEQKAIPRKFLRPILPSPRHVRGNIIESLPDGTPRTTPLLVLLDCSEPEAVLKTEYPDLWSYLELGKKRGVHNRYLAKNRKVWYQQEQRPPAPFLCSYVGRQLRNRAPFRFFWNKSKATATNSYLMMYPRGPLQNRLKSDPAFHETVLRILQGLDSGAVSVAGRIYGGGMQKLEPSELGSIPAGRLGEELGLAQIT
jgi:adenine-specific DNA-methyltransferase